ncbi:hypothetical protein [Clostridium culturomicium]|uniref:hypothetical protein n=1 Tax=Clostridium culturomicium TaxID=1499683 RepID=UPI00058E61F2|nr:hypothetical protein [Clostridium culturomicium]
MNKFDWDKFKNEKIAVNCRTEEAAKEFIEECYIRGLKWMNGSRNITYYNIHGAEIAYTFNFSGFDSLEYASTCWYKQNGCEIVEYTSEKKQTEFTFQEVIARNVPGVYVKTVDNSLRIEQVLIRQDGYIEIKADYKGIDFVGGCLGITDDVKFKLEESKQKYLILEIEHQHNGKIYNFRSDTSNLDIGQFVICDTSKGKSYGRIREMTWEELTQKGYEELKKCWRAM